ncbi:hypothetical protein LUZ60_017659 [Juncus effusus]|nr:hypothetical protein LUZ60_017659 [Juncus effusus]
MEVEHGKTYLLRVVNAGMSNGMFFAIYGHKFTIISSDGTYLKPFITDYLMIAVGETLDLLLEANQNPENLYYIAIRSFAYTSDFNPNITTAILQYAKQTNDTYNRVPLLPSLPYYNDTNASVKVLKYGERVEVVFQGTSLVLAEDHPLHLHGYSFYVMGQGFGNFNEKTDPLGYNYVDPPKKNTMEVPKNGWLAVRFQANNPGVWYLHCHLERHLTWGMSTAFIVKNGEEPSERILEQPQTMPPC